MKHEIEMVYDEHETKRTYRYREVDANGEMPAKPKIKQLYVQKTTLPNKPERIKVTIEAVE